MAFVQKDLIDELAGPLQASEAGSGAAADGFGDTRGFALHVVVSELENSWRVGIEDSADGINWKVVETISSVGLGLNVLRVAEPAADRIRLSWEPRYPDQASSITIASAKLAAS